MALNEQHPDYLEFKRKLDALWEEYGKIAEAEKAKYSEYTRGYDHPAYKMLRPIYREYCAKMKAIQDEYAYLYEPDDKPTEK